MVFPPGRTCPNVQVISKNSFEEVKWLSSAAEKSLVMSNQMGEAEVSHGETFFGCHYSTG